MTETPSSSNDKPVVVVAAVSTFSPRLILGVGVLLLGILLTLDSLDVIEADAFLEYWPVIFIAIGAAKLLESNRTGAWLTSCLWIALGSWWIAYNVGLTDIDVFELFWPVILMIGGWFLIRRAIVPRSNSGSSEAGDKGSRSGSTTGFALWTGVKRRIFTDDFTGGDFTAIMGGCDVDLTNARIKNTTAVLDVFAFWGGIEIKVPPEWSVQPEVTAILGGVADRSDPSFADGSQRLIVRGLAMMGGVDIRTVGAVRVPPPPTGS